MAIAGPGADVLDEGNGYRNDARHSAATYATSPGVPDHPLGEFTERVGMGCCHESSSMVVGVERPEM